MKSSGSSAASTLTSPPPAEQHGRLDCVRAVSAQAGAGGRDERRLDLRAASSPDAAGAGARRRRRRAAPPCSSRRRRRTGPPAIAAASRRGSAPPGAPTSGFSRCPNAVRPPEEKLVTTPPRPVSSSRAIAADAGTVARPPRPARRRGAPRRRGRRSCPPGTASSTGIAVRLAGAVVDDHDPDRAGRLRAGRLETNVQGPRETSAIAPLSEPGGQRARRRVRFARRAAEAARSTGCRPADDRADVDERLVARAPRRRAVGSGGARERNRA